MDKTKKTSKKNKVRNREFAVVSYLFVFLFLSLIGYFFYFMLKEKDSFIKSAYNPLTDLQADSVTRGSILSSDGQVLAQTLTDSEGGETRSYPYGETYAHVVGYAVNGKAGLENQENYDLLSSHISYPKQILNELRGIKNPGDNVYTTLDTSLQEAAYQALGDYDGAVVVIQPSTGKILAMVSKPSFDPNTIEVNWNAIVEGEDSVLVNRVTQGQYAPGSVFKIATTLAFYEQYPDLVDSYSFDCTSSFTYNGQTIHCSKNKAHGVESLEQSFAHSCNSSYANLSLSLDLKAFQSVCDQLLFNQELPLDLEKNSSHFTLAEDASSSLVMETAIGQGDTLVSPYHMALWACAIDNHGVLMTPYLVDHTENANGVVVSSNTPVSYSQLFTADQASLLKAYMRDVVEEGTGTKLLNQPYMAYGKTGTAQISDTSDDTNAWFVGFASQEGKEDIAIAVIVEKSGSGSSYAIPVAQAVFDTYFAQ